MSELRDLLPVNAIRLDVDAPDWRAAIRAADLRFVLIQLTAIDRGKLPENSPRLAGRHLSFTDVALDLPPVPLLVSTLVPRLKVPYCAVPVKLVLWVSVRSTSVKVTAPVALVTTLSSLTLPVCAALVRITASLVPVMVTTICWVAVPSNEVTVIVSWTV